MKWLQDNPVGMVLAAISGVLLLLMLGMTIVWNLPVSSEVASADVENETGSDAVIATGQIGPLAQYQVINEKPVFNESRTPVIDAAEDDFSEDDGVIEIKDAPDVKLTGVVITPGVKIASLTPAKGDIESVMAREGEALTGEYVGWHVSVISPRNVTLKSRDGRSLDLELQVHDTAIKEPPKPVEAEQTAQAAAVDEGQFDNEDNEPLSRAEQIRQRIADRREELRLEQELQQQQRVQSNPGSENGSARQAAKPTDYQSAIRALINKKPKEQGNNDQEEG